MRIIAYASTTRPNHLWSAAQFNSALPKNRTECDIPLVSKTEAEAALAAKDAEIARLEDELHDAQQVPWPEWAEKILQVVRSYSGYDGYDDATDGVDLVGEVEESLSELYSEAERLRAKLKEVTDAKV